MKIIDNHIEGIDKRMKEFTTKTKKDFEDMESDMMKEMTSRFDHQNEVIDDIREVITTFQKTLKVVGNKNPDEVNTEA